MPFTHPTRSGSVFPTLCWILLVFVGTACSGKTQEPIADPDWRYSLEKPVPGWDSESFDDTKWEQGAGGFGNPTTPGSRVGTEWNTKDIWLRRKVELKAVPKEPALYVHHDEDIEVFINGKQVLKKGGFVTSYQVIPIDAANRATLRAGMNTIAVYCHQTGGGQFVDVHLIDASNVPKLPKPKLSTSPFRSDLITRWGRQVTSENAWREYPRPQLEIGRAHV